MGADRGMLVKTDERLEPLAVAKALKAVRRPKQPGLVILGKQAIDDDCNQTGQMLAALLGWPQATFASKVDVDGGQADGDARGRRRPGDARLKMPAIITTDLRLNEPRYASLPNIMKAKKKPIDEKTAADFGVDIAPRLTVVEVSEPPPRQRRRQGRLRRRTGRQAQERSGGDL